MITKEAYHSLMVVTYPNGISKKKRWLTNPKVLPNSKIFVYAKPEKEQKENSGEGMDKFINILTVIIGGLTTIMLAKAL